jgi:hypothetical protein
MVKTQVVDMILCNLTCSSKWRMWVYFWYVCFENFSMVKKTFDLHKVHPCTFISDFWAIFEFQLPKWKFISKVLKMFHFHSHNVLNLFLALVYSQLISSFLCFNCHNLTLRGCEDGTHTLKMGTWESIETLEVLEFDCRGQNTSHWGVFYIIGKLSKRRCRKWARMSHLDICSTSYGKKKSRESNLQFDSRPLKVGNRPDLDACRWSATHRWKAFDESYNFASDLIPIGGLSKEL